VIPLHVLWLPVLGLGAGLTTPGSGCRTGSTDSSLVGVLMPSRTIWNRAGGLVLSPRLPPLLGLSPPSDNSPTSCRICPC
jgi:hypothetical protein